MIYSCALCLMFPSIGQPCCIRMSCLTVSMTAFESQERSLQIFYYPFFLVLRQPIPSMGDCGFLLFLICLPELLRFLDCQGDTSNSTADPEVFLTFGIARTFPFKTKSLPCCAWLAARQHVVQY